MISIYTRTNRIFTKERIKWEIKKILGKKDGPSVVLQNLVLGLKEIDKQFEINPKKPSEIVYVLSGVEALNDAIKWKKEDIVEKIFAGPNIITTPDEHKNIILDDQIDKIIVPSQWVKDFYLTFDKNIESKIEIWPAGVKIPETSSDKSSVGILYKKNAPEDILNEVINSLDRDGIEYKILEYGNFKQEEYFKLLEKAPWMIYLQKSESQGLSLFEAWSYNVPTLVWGNNSYEYKGTKYNLYKLSAPYLTEQSGSFFKKNNFKMGFESFVEKLDSFEPKKYVEETFSLKLAAKNFLDIINK